jgi:RHS repeat-associated protein
LLPGNSYTISTQTDPPNQGAKVTITVTQYANGSSTTTSGSGGSLTFTALSGATGSILAKFNCADGNSSASSSFQVAKWEFAGWDFNTSPNPASLTVCQLPTPVTVTATAKEELRCAGTVLNSNQVTSPGQAFVLPVPPSLDPNAQSVIIPSPPLNFSVFLSNTNNTYSTPYSEQYSIGVGNSSWTLEQWKIQPIVFKDSAGQTISMPITSADQFPLTATVSGKLREHLNCNSLVGNEQSDVAQVSFPDAATLSQNAVLNVSMPKHLAQSKKIPVTIQVNIPPSQCSLPGNPNTKGNPINTVTGEYTWSAEDFTLANSSTDRPLEFSRTYGNQRNFRGLLGANWAMNYDVRISEEPDSRLLLTNAQAINPQTFRIYFTPDSVGNYLPPAGVASNLERTDSDAFTLEMTGLVYDFSGGNLSAIRDEAGRVTAIDRDANGRILQVVDPWGRSLSFTYYDSTVAELPEADQGTDTGRVLTSGLMASFTDPIGRMIGFWYDRYENLTEVHRPDGTIWRYSYDATDTMEGHSMTKRVELGHGTDFDTIEIQYVAGSGMVESESDGNGNVLVQLAYSAAGDLRTEVTKPGMGTEIFGRGQDILPNRRVDALGNARSITRNNRGFITSSTDALGHTTTYVYSANDNLIEEIDPLGTRTLYEYPEGSQGNCAACGTVKPTMITVLDSTAVLLRQTINEYNEDQTRLLSRSEKVAASTYAVTVFTYTPDGLVATMTDPNGKVWTYEHDAYGNRTAEIDPLGNARRSTFDAIGRKLSDIDALGRTIATYEYDLHDKLIRTTHADGAVVAQEYDSQGRMIRRVEPLDAIWIYSYGARNELLEERDPLDNLTRYEYDGELRRTATILPDGTRNQIFFDSGGRLIREIKDAGGINAVIEHLYDAEGRETGTVDPEGRIRRTEFDAVGNMTAEINALGHTARSGYNGAGDRIVSVDRRGNTTTYEYDLRGNQVRMTDPISAIWTIVYDLKGNRLSTTDPSGAVTTWAYDNAGRQIQEINALGGISSQTYNALGQVVTRTDRRGNVWSMEYDAQGMGRLIRMTDPTNGVTTRSYDLAGNLTSVTDAENRTTAFEYDLLRRRTAVIDALSGRAEETYDNRGRLATRKDALNRVTTMQYDRLGRMTSIAAPDQGTTAFEFDKVGNRTAVVDALNRRTAFAYDVENRLLTITDPLQAVTTFEYDAEGNRTRTIDPNGTEQTATYDVLNRPATRSEAGVLVERNTFDLTGILVAVEDAEGGVTARGYDLLRRLTSETDARGGVTRFEYNPEGARTRLIDANGNAVTWTYDVLGRAVSEVDALGKTTAYAYDAVGNRTAKTDGRGVTTSWAYDALNRVTSESYSDTTPGMTFTYDAVGNRLTENFTVFGQGVTASYAYDGANRTTQKSIPPLGAIDYAYDLVGNRTSVTGAGVATAFAYDAANRRTTTTDGVLGAWTLTYDPAGRRTGLALPNGRTAAITYNNRNRITAITYSGGETVVSVAYTYDASGNRTSRTDDRGVHQYGYDELDRLVQAIYPDTNAESFTYDAVGNRLTRAFGSTSTNYTYNAANELVTAISTIETGLFSYDLMGNNTAKGDGAETTTYGYDARARMTSISGPNIGTQTAYDAERYGLRIAQAEGVSDTQYYLLDGPEVLADLRSNFTVSRRYVHGPAVDEHWGVAEYDTGGALTAKRYLLTDALGSVIAVTSDTGGIQARYHYLAFGTPYEPGDTLTRYRFTGREWNGPDVGLYYYRARWMDPARGRFTRRDPLGVEGDGPNLYIYAKDIPTLLDDPTGLVSAASIAEATLEALATSWSAAGWPYAAKHLRHWLHQNEQPRELSYGQYSSFSNLIKGSQGYNEAVDRIRNEVASKAKPHILACQNQWSTNFQWHEYMEHGFFSNFHLWAAMHLADYDATVNASVNYTPAQNKLFIQVHLSNQRLSDLYDFAGASSLGAGYYFLPNIVKSAGEAADFKVRVDLTDGHHPGARYNYLP